VKQVFSGRSPTAPGGRGRGRLLHALHLAVGSASCYVERFRGNDDLEGDLARRRRGADELAGLLLGWLTSELSQDPSFRR